MSVRDEDFPHRCASSIWTTIRRRFAGLDHSTAAYLPRHTSSSRDCDQRSQDRFTDGRCIRTSAVVTPLEEVVEGAVIETLNTRDLLGEEGERN